jgi:hypothetical protein
MTWLQVLQMLGPGLLALAGAWRASIRSSRAIKAMEAKHSTCTRDLAAMGRALAETRAELGLKRRDETAKNERATDVDEE